LFVTTIPLDLKINPEPKLCVLYTLSKPKKSLKNGSSKNGFMFLRTVFSVLIFTTDLSTFLIASTTGVTLPA
jgi:hypothetical protein